ncbi:hypothetical protein N8555_00860 [bacterium]|nr:hypothetical protein [bacterium]
MVTETALPIKFYTDDTERMEITPGGGIKIINKLGIGVTPSSYHLHVASGNKLLAGGYTFLERTPTSENNNILYVQSTGSANNQALAKFTYGATAGGANTGNETFVVARAASYFNSKLGIGVSPDAALDIQGSTNLTTKIKLTNTNPSTDNVWSMHANYSDQSLRFMGDSTLALKLDDSGQVTVGNLPTSTADNSLIVEFSGLLKKRTPNSGIWTTNLGANRLLVSNSSGVITSDSSFVHLGGRVSLTGAIDSGANLKVDIVDHDVTTNDTNHEKALFASAMNGYNISSGATDSGYRIAVDASAFVSDSDFEGTLNYQYGVLARHGAYVSGSGSTITNSYGVYIDSLTNSNTTITNLWGLYQANSTAKNYFAGSVGIGATPSTDFTVKGRFTYDDSTRLLTIVNSTNTGGINLSGGNSRIYFTNRRAIEGNTDGSNLTIGEGYTNTTISGGATLGSLPTSTTDTNVIVESSGLLKKRATDSSAFDGAAKEIRFIDVTSSSTIDLDTVGDGLYRNYNTTGNWSNTPLFMYGNVWSQTVGNNGFQLAFDIRHGNTNYGDLYLRTKNNSGFSDWRKIYHTGNLTLSSLSGVGGSGTDGKIPIWSGNTTTLGDSVITQNNGNVGVGASADSNYKLYVDGDTKVSGDIFQNSGNALFLNENRGWYRKNYVTTGAGVSNGKTVTLNNTHNQTASTSYHYRFQLTTVGTGTNTGATYIGVYNNDSSQWFLRAVSLSGNNSNHPQLSVSGSTFTAYTEHTSNYSISVSVETIYNGEADSTAHSLGADYHWRRFDTDLYYTNGNVGVGTASPDTKLHIADSGEAFLRLERTATNLGNNSGVGSIEFKSNDDSANGTGVVSKIQCKALNSYGNTFALAFSTGNGGSLTEKMVLDNDGRLHVKSSTATGANFILETTNSGGIPLLDLKGAHSAQLRYKDELDVIQGRIDFGDSGTFNFIDVPNNKSTLYLETGGNVGIGTDDPDLKLDVQATSAQANLGVKRTDGSWATLYGGSSFAGLAFDNAGYFKIAPGATANRTDTSGNGLIIAANGNVGIGTNDPQTKLHLSGGPTSLPIIRLQRNDVTVVPDDLIGGFENYSNDADGAFISSYIKGYATETYGRQGYLTFGTSGINSTDAAEKMRIAANGNIGINQVSPQAKLHITGSGSAGSVDNVLLLQSDVSNAPAIQFSETTGGSFNNGMNIAYRGDFGGGSDNAIVIAGISTSSSSVGDAVATFKNGGNCGIGTDDPSNQLTLYRATGDHFPISLQANNISTAGTYLGIQFGYTGGTYQKGALIYESQDSYGRGKMHFALDNNANSNNADITDAVMTLTHEGNVGINCTPNTSYKLDVNGDARVSGDIGFTGYLGQGSIYGNTGNASYARLQLYDPSTGYTTFNNISYGYRFQANGTNRLEITNAGAVKATRDGGSNSIQVARIHDGSLTGNGSATSFTVTHNLETAKPIAVVIDHTSGAYVEAQIVVASDNAITVTFNNAPSSGKVYRVPVTG